MGRFSFFQDFSVNELIFLFIFFFVCLLFDFLNFLGQSI